MTDTPREQSFRAQRQQTISKLLDDGWEVIAEPGPQQLPESLRDFRPDILAVRGSEFLVVEIKSRRSSDLYQLAKLASAITKLDNARLEVDWLGDAPESDPPIENIRAYMANVSTLLDAQHLTAALLVAWAALEGAVVYYASDKDDVQPWTTPWQLLSDLNGLGYVGDRDFERLTASWKLRNEMAHHVSSVTPQIGDIKFILDIADRMLTGRYVSSDQMPE
jgi:REase_AHJR-like